MDFFYLIRSKVLWHNTVTMGPNTHTQLWNVRGTSCGHATVISAHTYCPVFNSGDVNSPVSWARLCQCCSGWQEDVPCCVEFVCHKGRQQQAGQKHGSIELTRAAANICVLMANCMCMDVCYASQQAGLDKSRVH